MDALLKFADAFLTPLAQSGFSAYVVGGALRDTLMHRPVHDLDIATSATPEQVKTVFAHCKVIETGIRHGTVTVFSGGLQAEITTFRQEGNYSDRRHPDEIAFTTSIASDLSRRDFTINAMALGPGGLLDPYGGQADLVNGLIRCVGDPDTRFDEDPLRILRGLRFGACLGFAFEGATAQAMRQCKGLLGGVSAQRIVAELKRLVCGTAAKAALLEFQDVVAAILPELAPTMGFEQHNPYHRYDVYTHSVTVLSQVPSEPIVRLSALLHDIGKPACYTVDKAGTGHFHHHAEAGGELAQGLLKRLKFDNASRQQITTLVRQHGRTLRMQPQQVHGALAELGPALFFSLLDLDQGDNLSKSEKALVPESHWQQLRLTAQQLIDCGACLRMQDLAIGGNDLLLLGYTGPKIGAALNGLFQQVLQGKLQNEPEALLDALEHIKPQPPQ